MQPNYLEGLSFPGLLLLTSGGRKNKRTELDDRNLTLCNAKVGRKALVAPPPWRKCWGDASPSLPRFVITDFKRVEKIKELNLIK